MYNIEIDLYNRPRIFQVLLNTLKPRRNEQHFTDDIFIRIFFNENVWISVKISLTFVPMVPIKNIPAWVQIMTWCRPGDKPLYAPMMVIFFSTHIWVTRPQWIIDCAHVARDALYTLKTESCRDANFCRYWWNHSFSRMQNKTILSSGVVYVRN